MFTSNWKRFGVMVGVALCSQTANAQQQPVHRTVNSTKPAWWITQLGQGMAGEFETTNSNNGAPALYAVGNGPNATGQFVANGAGSALTCQSATGTASWFIANGAGDALYAESHKGTAGFFAADTNGDGLYGGSNTGYGGFFSSNSGTGVSGQSTTGYGVYGTSQYGYAGAFTGNVTVSGSVAAGAYFTNSDARYKTHIAPLINALDKVCALRGVTFDWRTQQFPDMRFGKERQIGFIAQEVEKTLPELVSKDKNGYRAVDYSKVVPVLVEAVKAQQQQIADLKQQVKHDGNASSSALFVALGGAPLLGLAFRFRRQA